MDCKSCKNYEPKAPFGGAKTADLKLGMLLREFEGPSPTGRFFTITGKPRGHNIMAIRIRKGYVPREMEIGLAAHGCQPYEDGEWHSARHLREVAGSYQHE